MKTLKKLAAFLLVAALLCVCTSAGAQGEETGSQTLYTPGVYTGTAWGMYSFTEVSVTVSETSIESIEITSCGDTEIIAKAAMAEMPGKIIDAQSVGVDLTTGATMTSAAIRGAVQDALSKACKDMSQITASVKVERTEAAEEDYDIVIVGGGGAGLSAAISAASKSDYSVLVLEKNAWTGGTTAVSGGGITVLGTHWNEMEGNYHATPEQLVNFFEKRWNEMKSERKNDYEFNKPLLTRLANRIPDLFTDLENEGIPLDYGYNWVSFGEEDPLVGDLMMSSVQGSGVVYGDWMTAKVLEKGAEIRTNSEVTEILTDASGIVNGVRVKTPDSTYTVHAKKVILCCGGTGGNPQLFREHNSDFENIAVLYPFLNRSDNGAAYTLLEGLNAQETGYGFIAMPGCVQPYGFTAGGYGPPYAITQTMFFWVNQNGERFVDESQMYYTKTLDLLRQPGGIAYVIASDGIPEMSELLEGGYLQLSPYNGAFKAQSIAELAELISVPADTLEQTITDYNEYAANGVDEEFGSDTMTPVLPGENYYAFTIYPTTLGTMDGFKTDTETFHLLDNDGEIIKNLFAAGEVVAGNFYVEEYVASGCSVGTAIYGGALAAEDAIAELDAGI